MIVGIDIGGTNTDVAVLEDGKFRVMSFKTSEVIASLPDFIEGKFKDAEAVGVGVAVWFVDGNPVKAPNLPLIPELSFKIPFVVDNDANCFAYYASKTTGYRYLLGVTVGTGIGGGIVADGKVYRGRGAAGEIGHTFVGGERRCVCGGIGHLETYFSGWALKNAEEMVESGRVYETEGFRIFCISLANAALILNPEAIAFGGRIGGRLDVEIVKGEMEKFLPEEIELEVVSIKDDYAVAKGAALLALDTISETHQ
jgi:glucokinase/N-acetylglucosamine kinase